MSRKNRGFDSEALVEVEVPVVEEEVLPRIPFLLWFEGKVKEGKIRAHQDYALSVFFEKRGLTDNETSDAYEKAFKSF
jgi:hypothetical protein